MSGVKSILVTGSSGLIGSEVALHFHQQGFLVHGADNNQRAVFFGPPGDNRWNQKRLQTSMPDFTHHELDIRDRAGVLALVERLRPPAIVHTAEPYPAQGTKLALGPAPESGRPSLTSIRTASAIISVTTVTCAR